MRTGNVFLGIPLGVLILAGSAFADELIYEPGRDPGVGVNLISWWNFGAGGEEVWENAVQDVYDHGFRDLSIIPFRFVDLSTGALSTSPKTPDTTHIAAGLARAQSLGMTVTLNPFVEPEDFSTWRGTMNFVGAAKTKFFSNYTGYLEELADVAQANGVARMTVGSELRTLVRDTRHNADWANVIDAVDARFDGELGYAANWDNYRHANLTSTIWENAKIDFVGVDAYFPLATSPQADSSGVHPDAAFMDLLQSKWDDVLSNPSSGILSFAAGLHGGAGMPVVFTEHGLIPYNRTTVAPYSTNAGYSQPVEPDEQLNGYDALLRASDHLGESFNAIHFWNWWMPGADGSFWSIHPDAEDNPNTYFDETLGRPAGKFLSYYACGPFPGDTNVDRDVDFADFNTLANNYTGRGGTGKTWGNGDFDQDGDVDFADFNALANHYTGSLNTAHVPEPSTLVSLAMVGVGLLACVWRRRYRA